MAILRATFTAFVDQGVSGDSLPMELEWSSTTPTVFIAEDTVSNAADHLVAAPAGTTPTLVLLVPPVGNTVTYRVKGVVGDTGAEASATAPMVWPYQSGFSIRATTAPIARFMFILF